MFVADLIKIEMLGLITSTTNNNATEAVGKVALTMLWAPPASISSGVNYDPMNPTGAEPSWKKDAKASTRVEGLVTKIRNGALFSGWHH
mmetsp:Transcript_3380/g.8182  ORF Transcript_3380/g.8182 Transcript_3380/m.8182 type:complete len:89 (+) Transcript_3380:19-285(+)